MSKQPQIKPKETLPDKIKNLFGRSKGLPVSSAGSAAPRINEFVFTTDILKELGIDSPVSTRVNRLNDLCDLVQCKRLEENAVEVLWLTIADMLHAQAPLESRHLVLKFLQCLIIGQNEQLGIMRAYFFAVLKDHDVAEDTVPRFEAFSALCEAGKDLYNFEEEVGPFLLQWMPNVLHSSCALELLALLVNVVKYNATYLDQDIVSGLVQHVCEHILHCMQTNASSNDIEMCTKVLDAVICYSFLPADSLSAVITTLCWTVNRQDLCKNSWELMRKLLGTHLGHSAIYTMCRLLQDKGNLSTAGLLRGAVFYIGMALWGHKRVESLRNTPSSVLPSFKQALQCNHKTIVYEVVLSVSRLVKKYGSELPLLTWDLIMDIAELILKHIENADYSPESELNQELHDMLTNIEEQNMGGNYSGCPERLYDIVERCSQTRPEESVLRLINHRGQYIHPMKDGWITNLAHLLEKYFHQETRSTVRVRVLEKLQFVLNANKHLYEDDLIEKAVIPYLSHIDSDEQAAVREVAVALLVELCQGCQSKRCLDLLGIISNVCKRPLDQRVSSKVGAVPASLGTEVSLVKSPILPTEVCDIETAVLGVIDIFKVKFSRLPSSQAVRAFEILVNHIQLQYNLPLSFNIAVNIRHSILELFCSLRANTLYHICLVDKKLGSWRASPYLLCTGHGSRERKEKMAEGTTSPPVGPPVSPSTLVTYDRCKTTAICMAPVFATFVQCLKIEKDWKTLGLVLGELPSILQNKTLVLTANANVELLTDRLCAMVSDRRLGYPDVIHNLPPKFTRSDFQGYVFSVLGTLAAYYGYLDKSMQVTLIKSLEDGRLSRCAGLCINTLIICTLEMQDVMMRQLPEVLLRLSQISATKAVAIPMLEFLSCLIRLPRLYANFVEEQYMSVFAIAAPYTNPAKFTHYTASLAHQVIALWFLKCRIIFRKDFVRFITKGLKANVLLPFEESALYEKYKEQKEEIIAPKKQRSSSIVEAVSGKDSKPASPLISRAEKGKMDKPGTDESLTLFHTELTETCLDMMARYTFAVYSSLPQRSPVGEFLMSGGQSLTWLVGNKLVTITTSGGTAKMVKPGLCEKCSQLVQPVSQQELDLPLSQQMDYFSSRRRHHSAFMARNVSESQQPLLKSQDDIQLRNSSGEHLDELGKISLQPRDALRSTFTNSSSTGSAVLLASAPWKSDPLHSSERLVDKQRQLSGPHLCNCWCQDWAEILVRRPTGNTSWMMRIQNMTPLSQEFQLSDISNFFLHAHKEEDMSSANGTSRSSRRIKDVSTINEAPNKETSQLELDIAGVPAAAADISVQRISIDSDTSLAARESISSDTKDTLGPLPSPQSVELSVMGRQVSLDSIDKPGFTLGINPSDDQTPTDYERPVLGMSPCLTDNSALKDSPFVTTAAHLEKPVKRVNSSPSELVSSGMGDADGATKDKFSENLDSNKPSTEAKHEAVDKVAVPVSKLPEDATEQFIPLEPLSPVDSYREQFLQQDSLDSTRSSSSDEQEGNGRFRHRGHTVSVMGGRRAYKMISRMKQEKQVSAPPPLPPKTGINPGFVFLQLYHSSYFVDDNERPLLLPQSDIIDRAVKNLDRIPPYETYKVGVLYVGPGQANDETAILSNEFGSSRYAKFLEGLGDLKKLKDTDPDHTFLGGLDKNGNDGEFAYSWQDDIMQVIFHVATLMPNKPSDKHCNSKKMHIGNDFVSIVYNDSGEEYKTGTIKGQFRLVSVIIRPLDHESNVITVHALEELKDIVGHGEPKIISDRRLPVLARQIALHANLASIIYQSQQRSQKEIYASKWLERLRQIKRIRNKVLQDFSVSEIEPDAKHVTAAAVLRQSGIYKVEDFTKYL